MCAQFVAKMTKSESEVWVKPSAPVSLAYKRLEYATLSHTHTRSRNTDSHIHRTQTLLLRSQLFTCWSGLNVSPTFHHLLLSDPLAERNKLFPWLHTCKYRRRFTKKSSEGCFRNRFNGMCTFLLYERQIERNWLQNGDKHKYMYWKAEPSEITWGFLFHMDQK